MLCTPPSFCAAGVRRSNRSAPLCIMDLRRKMGGGGGRGGACEKKVNTGRGPTIKKVERIEIEVVLCSPECLRSYRSSVRLRAPMSCKLCCRPATRYLRNSYGCSSANGEYARLLPTRSVRGSHEHTNKHRYTQRERRITRQHWRRA
jgi:hypothetical protein